MRIGRNLSDDVYSNKIVVSFVANPFGNAMEDDSSFYTAMRNLAGGAENINYIKRSATPPAERTLNVRNLESRDSQYEILMWYDSNLKTLYYFTEGEKIELSQYCNQMFSGMSNLRELDLSSFDTSRVTSFYQMFMGASSLKKLDLSGFKTSKIKVMVEMFKNMISLEEVDLSNFDMSKVEQIGEMFDGDVKLRTIYATSDLIPGGKNFDWLGVFRGCVNLVGGNGSKMAESELPLSGHDWMRIDRPGVPGYLTLKK